MKKKHQMMQGTQFRAWRQIKHSYLRNLFAWYKPIFLYTSAQKKGTKPHSVRSTQGASLALVASLAMRRVSLWLKTLLTVVAVTQLVACSRTVQWEEEVPLNTGETIWVKRTVVYSLQGGAGNPLDIAYRPDWIERLEFRWDDKAYIYEGEAQVFVLAISPQRRPVLVADPDDGTWRGKHDYRHCTKPTYVQLVPDEEGRTWSWPSAIEGWLYGLPANLMRSRGKVGEMKTRYTAKDRANNDALGWRQSPEKARIDPTYVSTGFCKGRV